MSLARRALDCPGLRFGLMIELSVAITVPCPSATRAPPSETNGAGNLRSPSTRSTSRAILASWAWACLLPQPLKFRSRPASPPRPLTKNTGPMSRIHRSSLTSATTSTCLPQARAASRACSGRATIATGSKAAMARATVATSPRTPGSIEPQMSWRAGQAIQVRSCRTPSPGTNQPSLRGLPAAGRGLAFGPVRPPRSPAAPLTVSSGPATTPDTAAAPPASTARREIQRAGSTERPPPSRSASASHATRPQPS